MTSSSTGIRIHDPDPRAATPTVADGGLNRPLSLKEYMTRHRLEVLGVTLTLFGIFIPVVIVPYAFSDDYTDLWMAVSGEPTAQFGKNIIDASAITGRPFSGFLIQWFFSAAGSIDNLRFVRLVGVITIVALALLLCWGLIRSRIKPIYAALIAVFVCSLPAFQVYGSWAVLFSAPLAALLAGAASLLTVAAVDAPRGRGRDRLLASVALLFAALLIYQPGAMFFWVFFAVALVGAVESSERSVALVRTHFAVGAVGLILAYAELKLTVHFMGSATGAGRNHLTHDIGGKAHWFFHDPLYHALNLFDLTPTPWFAALVATVAATGILLRLLERCTRPVLYAIVALVLIPLTYLPNLVVTESWAAYRTQVALSSLIALYFCFGAITLWLTFRDWLRVHVGRRGLLASDQFALAFSVVFVGVSVLAAARNVLTLFVEPHITEQRMLRSQVAALPDGVQRFAFVVTDPFTEGGRWPTLSQEGMSNLVAYDEFGLPSSDLPWTLAPSVNLMLHDEGRLQFNGPHPKLDAYQSWSTAFPKGEPVIDLRGLLKLREP